MMMNVVIRFVLLSIAYLVSAGQMSTDECVAAVLSATGAALTTGHSPLEAWHSGLVDDYFLMSVSL